MSEAKKMELSVKKILELEQIFAKETIDLSANINGRLLGELKEARNKQK